MDGQLGVIVTIQNQELNPILVKPGLPFLAHRGPVFDLDGAGGGTPLSCLYYGLLSGVATPAGHQGRFVGHFRFFPSLRGKLTPQVTDCSISVWRIHVKEQ